MDSVSFLFYLFTFFLLFFFVPLYAETKRQKRVSGLKNGLKRDSRPFRPKYEY
jgi:preprotein translocase subunit YajC